MTVHERKEREKKQRRNSILLAAEALFAKLGLHEASLDAIAEKAEISKGTVYLYFKSKEDLFFSVIAEKYREYFTGLESVLVASSDLKTALEALVRYQLSHSRNHQHFFRIIMAEQPRTRSRAQAEMRAKFIQQNNLVLEMVTRELNRHFPAEGLGFSARTLALSVTGTINAYVMSWLISGRTDNLAQAEQEILTVYYHGIKN